MSGEHDPHDETPLRSMVPDHSWFPCPHCGKRIQCPPLAQPVAPALERKTPIKNPTTKIIPPTPPPSGKPSRSPRPPPGPTMIITQPPPDPPKAP